MSGTKCCPMSKRNGLPPNVTEFQDRHGKWHLRFRAKGQPTYYFKYKPGTEEFRAELEACRAGDAAPASRTSTRTKPGSISALIAVYYSTPAFTGLAVSSKKTYRNVLERFRQEHGEKSVATLQRVHIKAMLGAMADRPGAANGLLDKLRLLMQLALDEGWRKDDPTQGIKGFRINSDGFHTWTEDEIAAFEARHLPGSMARRALSIMLYTGQRRSDAITAGRQHVSANRIRVRQQKTGTHLSIPLHPTLQAELALAPADTMTFLMTEHGRPFASSASFGNKMRDWCNQAGLPHCTAHGLRKAAARRLAEAGCTNQQIKAITGHVTDSEVSRYTAAANQAHLADQAMLAVAESAKRAAKGPSERDFPRIGM